jgi:mRNA interferase MazF
MVKIEIDELNNLTKTSSADCFQIRSLSQERFIKRIGEIKPYQLEEIKKSIMKTIQF